jgi:predicted dehydrogenase
VKAEARAAEYGLHAYTDLDQMLAREQPDLVAVCLPNQVHFEPTLQVIRAGCPLLVEKPLVYELAQADALIEEAARRNLFFAINFNHHYAKPVAMAHAAIAAGRLGELAFATWRFGGRGGIDHPFNNLIETQCHGFDMLLCGPIDSIMAEMTDKTHPGVYRTLACSLHFHNGAIGSLVGSYDTSYACPNTHSVEVSGSKARVLIEDTVRRYTFNAADDETAEVWQAGYFNDVDRSFYQTFDQHMDHLLSAFKTGQQPPVHAAAGRRALQLAYAAIESYRTGRRVPVGVESFSPAAAPPRRDPPPSP